MLNIADRIAQELAVAPRQVTAAVQLLDEGSTVPFISRYRKEVTGGLDDTQLRNLEERLGYLRELEERRAAVLKSIEEQGKLTPSLTAAIQAADTKTRLEDLYLPFKQKRRTKGQIAIEAGIQPLAEALLANPQLNPETEAAKYINKSEDFKDAFVDSKGVLEGAKYILMERFAED
ncbi:MAG TPA: Tex-like N-terminal domain-containing protein, partial [Thiolinea sp.]|nr:Tex-like N-terminal domain-containing protein [Thiolinea sp.]